MASKASRRARYLPENKLEISLFPFLSIFLSVMGVLSFINILSSIHSPQKIKMTTELEAGYKVAFQMFSLPDGIIIVPPVSRLKKLQAVVDDDVRNDLADIIQRRERFINNVKAYKGALEDFAVEPEVDEIVDLLKEIRFINEEALKHNFLYEEFILFGIYPEGSEAYRKVRNVMARSQDAASISIGLEPLDANWTLNIDGTPTVDETQRSGQ
ncbi:MAG: hypothetical protein DSZ29_03970 [Aquificaceae bacterium]|nr:MAG: hypothetical protein DSZ29_03970 [Aquificaceae bacterium]